MTSLALKKLVLVVLQNHVFSFDNKIYKQTSGGAIGDRLTGALGALVALVHSRELLDILRNSGAVSRILQVYTDDGNHCMKALVPGSRYNRETQRIEVVDEEIENDRLVSADLRTANVVKDVANSIFEFWNVKIDCPSLHEDGFMPILDIKAKTEAGKIVYMFYKKPLSNDRVILASSAMPHNVKMATMVNEAIRRLRNTSRTLPWATKAAILTRFSNDLRISGYNQQFREKVIQSATTGFQRQCEAADNGGIPLHRPRNYERAARRKKKLMSKESWFHPAHDVVGFFPVTEGSWLVNGVKKIMQEEGERIGFKIKVVEKSGTPLAALLSRPDLSGCLFPDCRVEDTGTSQTGGSQLHGNLHFM